ncbi:MAG: hypothetical protein HQK50_15510 [Oligoflexia bacterium]|nr:hypothetical protein [Oligoflexia bacterium]MBF0366982.1 hypothetical protein [Oligoflexia bacterium]
MIANKNFNIKQGPLRERQSKMINESIIPIQNALIVCNSEQRSLNEEYIEFNPDLHLIDTQRAYWNSIEYESKINVNMELQEFKSFLQRLEQRSSGDFGFGPLARSMSFERHFLLRSGEAEIYVVKLGKKNWKQKVAMKLKEALKETKGKETGILVRSMKINEWSDDAFENVCAEMSIQNNAKIKIKSYRSFYKKKLRAVCLNRIHGIVFGVSLDQSKVTGRTEKLSQIEIEYWSTLLPKTSNHQEIMNNLVQSNLIQQIQVQLCSLVMQELQQSGFAFKKTTLTKSEWVRGVSECTS